MHTPSHHVFTTLMMISFFGQVQDRSLQLTMVRRGRHVELPVGIWCFRHKWIHRLPPSRTRLGSHTQEASDQPDTLHQRCFVGHGCMGDMLTLKMYLFYFILSMYSMSTPEWGALLCTNYIWCTVSLNTDWWKAEGLTHRAKKRKKGTS